MLKYIKKTLHNELAITMTVSHIFFNNQNSNYSKLLILILVKSK